MPHHPKPIFRPERGVWYVVLDGKHVPLGKYPDDLPPPKKQNGAWPAPKEVLDSYHRVMAGRGQLASAPAVPGQGPPVIAILDAFLEWLEKRVQEGRKEPRTYDWYRDYLQSFVSFLPPLLTCDQLIPDHVYRWTDSHPGWKTGKRGAMIAVQRAFNWAAKAGLLRSIGGHSPLAGLEKPPQGRRKQLIPEAEFETIMAGQRNEAFKDLCTVCYETGCRPHEVMTVEARHVELKNACWIFPPEEAKGKKFFRVVYLTARALEITRRLVAEHPEGPLFRNSDGRPWHTFAVNCAFGRVQIAIGMKRMKELGLVEPKLKRLKVAERGDRTLRGQHEKEVKARRVRIQKLARKHGRRFCLYNLRHSWATRALQNGVDPMTVSVLMGHADASTLARVYQHLAQDPEYLREQARRARGSGA